MNQPRIVTIYSSEGLPLKLIRVRQDSKQVAFPVPSDGGIGQLVVDIDQHDRIFRSALAPCASAMDEILRQRPRPHYSDNRLVWERRHVLLPLEQHRALRRRRLNNMKYPCLFGRLVLRLIRHNADYDRFRRPKRA